jgi:CubicO group peptidase (beta-lactamase class C family)
MRTRCTMTIAAACAVALATVVTGAAAGFDPEKLAAVRLTLQASIDAGELPGVVTLVWRKGELAQVNALGYRDIERGLPMEADTIFRIASMSKPITSVATLMLVEEGALKLDDPITRWVPEFATMRVLRRPDGPLEDTYPAPRKITVEDLLTHRSGLAYPYTATGPLAAALEKTIGSEIQSRLAPDDWMKALATLPLMYAPGERFQYGVSTNLLGFVVARASGMSLRDFLLTRVFGPLGMGDTDFWIPPAKRDRGAVLYASGADRSFRRMDSMPGFVGSAPPMFISGGEGLVTTARDYLTFARLLLNRGEVNGVRLLKPQTVMMMTSNRLTPAQRQLPFLRLPIWRTLGFGLGVSMITNAQAYNASGVGAGADGAFSWPGSFGGWWQVDPAEDMVALFLPQLQPSIAQLVPAATTMRAFQKLVYEAIER